jgi:hypothetical protein
MPLSASLNLALSREGAHCRRMGDKSPKAKQRDKKQKNVAKAADAERARGKQDSFAQPIPPRGKK